MRRTTVLFAAFGLLLFARPAHADLDSVAARELARGNNCTPSKVDIFRQTLGPEGSTIFLVSCTLPKMMDDKGPKPADQLMINCRDNLCAIIRPMAGGDKK